MNKETINFILAAIATFFTWLFGAWDTALAVLVTFMIVDYNTGLLKAYILKCISSDTGLKGIARKTLILAVLIVAVSVDRLINNGQWIFRTMVCYFYIGNEGISILENGAQLGLPLPEKFKDALLQLKQGQKKEYKGNKAIKFKK